MLRSDLKPECVASRPSRSPPSCGYCIVNIVCMGFLHDHTDLIEISLPVCRKLVLVCTTWSELPAIPLIVRLQLVRLGLQYP